MKSKKWLIVATLCLVVVSSAAFAYPLLTAPGVYSGVTLEGVAVGGKSRAEVRQIISLWGTEFRNRKLTLYYGDTSYRLDAAAIDYDLDVEGTVDEVWNFGRRGAWWERLGDILASWRGGRHIAARVHYNEGKLQAFIDQWREAIDRPPRNAALSLITGGVLPPEKGRRLDVEALKPQVLQALHKSGPGSLALPVVPLEPEVTLADLDQTGLKEFWATFSTVFDASDINRTANIKLAARKVNGLIVYPGQVFSFNQVVGPRDKEHGFKEAMEIVNGEFVPGIGGGVCQLSSTLYNAVLLANLPIVERTNHSKPLGYVDLGRDATVAYAVLDFRFANNSDTPLMILADTEKNRLMVGIVGQRVLGEQVEVLSVNRQLIPPQVVKKQDPTLELGESKLEKHGRPGYEVTMVRVVSAQGREIKREVLGKDRYLPDDTLIKVGTKLPPEVKEEPSAKAPDNPPANQGAKPSAKPPATSQDKPLPQKPPMLPTQERDH